MKESFKIPDSALLKESRKEVGQLSSEIDYLNQVITDKDTVIKELDVKLEVKNKVILTSEEKKSIRAGILYENQKTQITSLNTKVRKLARDKEDLLKNIIELKKKLAENVFN